MVGNSVTEESFPADRNVPLNFDKLVNNNNHLSDTHVWSSGQATLDQHQMSETVPVINVSEAGAGRLMHEACATWGVFQAVGHGLPVSLLKEVEAETRRLFALPMDTKLLAVNKPGGYSGYGLPKMSKFYPTQIWSEGFTIMGSPAEQVTKLWPDEAQCNRFCHVMNEYRKEADMLSKKIISLMLTSLGLTEDELPWMKAVSKEPPLTALRLNSYPGQATGMAPHTDTSMVTMLYQGSVGGLEIEREGGEWVKVRPVDGALVVNLGDLMHILSNGKLKSVMHRVVMVNGHHRISVGYFYGPPRDVEVGPAEKLVGKGKSPNYRTVTWEEYMNLKHTHGQKALHMIRSS